MRTQCRGCTKPFNQINPNIRYCIHCLRERAQLKVVDVPKLGSPRSETFNALEFREEFEFSGMLFTGDEIHRIIHYHWRKNPDTWFRDNVTTREFLLRQLPRMIQRCPTNYRIPMRQIFGVALPTCKLCGGNGRWIDFSRPSHDFYKNFYSVQHPDGRRMTVTADRNKLEEAGCTDIKFVFPAIIAPCECITITEVEA